MEIYNYMETIVVEELDGLLKDIEDICKCKKCRLDMMVCALNKLSPKYVVSERGRMFTKLQGVDVQLQADVVKELTKAILKVSKNPQHVDGK